MTSLDGKRTIRTVSGRYVDPFALQPEDVCLRDIATSLSNLCRYTGHVETFISVAEHSVLVSRAVSPENRRHALLHDACEAYFGDMAAPLKHQPEEKRRRDAEDRASAVIFERFGLAPELPGQVDEVDKAIRYFECVVRGMTIEQADEDFGSSVECARLKALRPSFPITPTGLSPREARALFLTRYLELFDDKFDDKS